MPTGTLYIVSAPSGAGKTSLVHALREKDPRIAFSISHTTRAARPGEQDGIDYHFVSRDLFQSMAGQNKFLEHARVFDNDYGTTREEVTRRLETGTDVVLDIDWQGARQVRERMPECVSIFIVPPSQPALEGRVRGRGPDRDKAIARRMRGAGGGGVQHVEYDYLIINDDFDTALAELAAIFGANRLRLAYQRDYRRSLLEALMA